MAIDEFGHQGKQEDQKEGGLTQAPGPIQDPVIAEDQAVGDQEEHEPQQGKVGGQGSRVKAKGQVETDHQAEGKKGQTEQTKFDGRPGQDHVQDNR